MAYAHAQQQVHSFRPKIPKQQEEQTQESFDLRRSTVDRYVEDVLIFVY